jgi:outer membrane receptor protein involved in Fe transport
LYLNYHIDDTSRLSLFANASYADFQIPNTPSLPPAFTVAGTPTANSADVDENQNEQQYYTVASYQKTDDKLSLQLSAFSSYGQIRFTPDPLRDLIFQGVAGEVYNNFITNGVQFDSSYALNDQHTIRAGFVADYTLENLNTNTSVFGVDPATGGQASDVPFSISDDSSNHAVESGVYVQDEWRISPKLTLNYGLRYDRFDSNFDTSDQLSPRVNAVYKIDDKTTIHGGYAHYFVTPPVQDVDVAIVEKFAGTTNAPDNFRADAPKVETSHYFDLGISRQITPQWQTNLDGFYKIAHNLIDLGQFGDAVILSPFNYKSGKVYGGEWSNTYRAGGFSAFGNVSWVETRAHDIDSQQFQIDNDELNFISDHDIKLDHEAEIAGALGASYQWKNDLVYIDMLYGTGLRSGFSNTGQVQAHYPVNLGYEHVFHLNEKNAMRFRFDVVNVFDEKYEIRDGSGIGVGAPQFGQRLSFFGGITYEF